MTYDPLPERWEDEPWPLDEPDLPAFRTTNRSSIHDNPPQVADLADEAWQYAVDHGVTMEHAFLAVQRLADLRAQGAQSIDITPVTFTSPPATVSVDQDKYRCFGGPAHGRLLPCRTDVTLVPVAQPVSWRRLADPLPMAPAIETERYDLRKMGAIIVSTGKYFTGKVLVHEDYDDELVEQELNIVLRLTRPALRILSVARMLDATTQRR